MAMAKQNSDVLVWIEGNRMDLIWQTVRYKQVNKMERKMGRQQMKHQ